MFQEPSRGRTVILEQHHRKISGERARPAKAVGQTFSNMLVFVLPRTFSCIVVWHVSCHETSYPCKRRSSMVRHAAPLARQPLSTYGWQQSRPAVLEWLEQSIQYAVQKLDKAPFLELVHSDKQDTHCSIFPVAEAVVESPQVSVCADSIWMGCCPKLYPPICKSCITNHTRHAGCKFQSFWACLQLWRGIAEHLSSSKPEIVILLHQLPPVEDEHKSTITNGQWSSHKDSMFTGMASHEALNQSRLKYCSMLLRDGIAEGLLAGKVGDCCEGDVQNQILPFSKQQHSQTNWDQHKNQQHRHTDSEEQLVDFWGLIVQSKVMSDAEGAYVLKTVRNSNPVGCQCTHYSLMRVCKGDLVKTHMSSAWLLNK